MGCQFGQNADVTGDIAKATSPFLGTWISWETFPVTYYCLPGHVLGEKEQLEKRSRFSA